MLVVGEGANVGETMGDFVLGPRVGVFVDGTVDGEFVAEKNTIKD